MFMSTKEAAEKWSISERRVRVLCAEGRVDGVVQSSWAYLIPRNAPKPSDGRTLRHLKQERLRLGSPTLERLEQFKAPDGPSLVHACRQGVDAFIVASFAVESMALTTEELGTLTSGEIVPTLALSTHLLSLHMRSIILSMARQSKMGERPLRMSEQYLVELYQLLCQGLEGDGAEGVSLPGIASRELEVLFIQDEQEFSSHHPLVRALFFYAEIMRIAPFHAYNGLLAALVYARIMTEAGWAPALVSFDRIDELKAALVMTKRRGNYLSLTDLVGEAYGEQAI